MNNDNWEYISTEDVIWARKVDQDPYGITREVLMEREGDMLSVRHSSNERAPHVLAQVDAPVDIIVEVLRRAGWTVLRNVKGP